MWSLCPWGSPEVLVLPSAKDIKAGACTTRSSLLLAEDGSVWKSFEAPNPCYLQVRLPVKVKQVATNGTSALILTDNGKVYSMGDDADMTGILGFKDIHSLSTPRLIPVLSTTSLIQVSIGKTHAAALDSKLYTGLGVVYTWGSGIDGQLAQGQLFASCQMPTRVETSNIFSVKQVVCGDTYTCTCTNGGYVYTYGRLGGHKATRNSLNQLSPSICAPYSVPELEQHFAASISGCSSCVIVLSDAGLAFIFDDCAELVRLPTASNVGVKVLAGCGDTILGLSGDG